MLTENHKATAGTIWDIANRLRGPYRPPQYRLVMLPMVVLRRFDCVLEPSKDAVKAAFLDFTVEIIRRSADAKGFEVLPRRWVVERSFGWMIRWRHLVRDYEARIDISEAMILVAMGGNLLRRNAHT